jgi:hypothetical protein
LVNQVWGKLQFPKGKQLSVCFFIETISLGRINHDAGYFWYIGFLIWPLSGLLQTSNWLYKLLFLNFFLTCSLN